MFAVVLRTLGFSEGRVGRERLNRHLTRPSEGGWRRRRHGTAPVARGSRPCSDPRQKDAVWPADCQHARVIDSVVKGTRTLPSARELASGPTALSLSLKLSAGTRAHCDSADLCHRASSTPCERRSAGHLPSVSGRSRGRAAAAAPEDT